MYSHKKENIEKKIKNKKSITYTLLKTCLSVSPANLRYSDIYKNQSYNKDVISIMTYDVHTIIFKIKFVLFFTYI